MNKEDKLQEYKREYEGKTFKTKSYGDVIVLEYVDSSKILIQFLESGGKNFVSSGNLRKGLVRDFMARTIYGVGYFGEGKYICRVKGRTAKSDGHRAGCMIKEYASWESMMKRVYGNLTEQEFRIYHDVTVCEEWHNYQNYAEWCQNQAGFGLDGYHLDKDILVRGNRVYSPSSCCFVPAHINSAVTGMKHTNTTGFTGVSSVDYGFSSEITMNGTSVHLGTFSTAEKAFKVYKSIKEAYVRSLAEVYKDGISSDAYEALTKWEVL